MPSVPNKQARTKCGKGNRPKKTTKKTLLWIGPDSGS